MKWRKLTTAEAAEEITSNADTLRTLMGCIQTELSESDIKRELMGTYADFYRGDIRRVNSIMVAMEKLLDEIEDFGDALYWKATEEEGATA